MNKMKISEWVKQKREESGLTVSDLANRVGCSVTSVGSIEREQLVPFKSINNVAPYRPGEKLMTSIAAQFGKSLEDVYNETDYEDLTVKKKGFGYNHPNRGFREKVVASESFKLEQQTSDSSLPPIKFFVIREKSLKINNIICEKVIVKTCDSKEFAMGYINGANNRTEENVEFKMYQGYLMEVEIER
jgi:DNA-binding XRE family transcriptional regulator